MKMGLEDLIIPATVVVLGVAVALASFKIVTPRERGVIERFGKYNRYAEPGLQMIIPFVESMTKVDITEDMVDAKQQEVITKDSLNALVDAQIYFKVREDEESVKKSQYAVNDYYVQIVSLARTTLRAIMGELTLTQANSEREKINIRLKNMLSSETKNWGIDVVRAELKEIQPPSDVQDVMNKVVIAEKDKQAAIDFATAVETKADGAKRAVIKEAEGNKQMQILDAQGQAAAIEMVAKADAERIKLVNESAKKYFTGSAVELKRLETAQVALKDNTKYFVSPGTSLINVIGDATGTKIIPIEKK
jgi:regulator of protease activity HflC (stomatin/prohibitin superfamily)